MRKISPRAVVQFAAMASLDVGCAISCAWALSRFIPPSFLGVFVVTVSIALTYIYAIALFRLQQYLNPLESGDIPLNSPAEQRAFVYTLHYLIFFNTLIFNALIPVPLMRLILQALGAKMGENTYSSGIVMDPQFVHLGDNTIIGNGAMLIPHVIEGQRLGFYPIRLGNDVTIGARAVVMADVEIGDGATVAVQAVVAKGTRIPAGEVWGGIPARRLRTAGDAAQPE